VDEIQEEGFKTSNRHVARGNPYTLPDACDDVTPSALDELPSFMFDNDKRGKKIGNKRSKRKRKRNN